MCHGHPAERRRAEGLRSTYITDPTSGAQHLFATTIPDAFLLGQLPKDLDQYVARGQFMIMTVGKQVPD